MRKFIPFFVLIMAYGIVGCDKKSHQQPLSEEMTTIQENIAEPLNQEINAQANEVSEVPATAAPEATQTALTSAPTSIGTAKDIQTAIKNAGLYQGKIDGTIGPKTKDAIKKFQQQNGLKVDGKVGLKTWTKLSTYLTLTNPTSTTTSGEQSTQLTY